MAARSFVSFEADFPTDGQPAGRELATFLAAALSGAGLPFSEPVEREGWAWDLLARMDSSNIEAIVAFTDDGPLQWQVHIYARVGLARRLFRRNRDFNIEALGQVARALHTVISSDPRFRSIRWYDPDVFDKDYGATWTPEP
jgi:hypothetical protein